MLIGMKRILLFILISVSLLAAEKNPISKAYIAGAEGEATVFISTEGRMVDTLRRVYNADGLIFETKKKSNQTIVLSNSSGIYIGENSLLEIKKFIQEPFRPNRIDIEIEPSMSQTRAIIFRGNIAICTPKIVSGSSAIYQTPHCKVKLFNNKVVILVEDNRTTVYSVEGELSIDVEPNQNRLVGSGEKASVEDNKILVEKMNKKELELTRDRLTISCRSRKEVYFEMIKENDVLEMRFVPIINLNLPTQFTVSPTRID